MIKIVKISKKVSGKGYPVHTKSGNISKKGEKAHKKHTKRGRIIISKIVPKGLRLAVVEHETVEHRLMTPKKK